MTMGQILPFNPLDKKNLGASVAEALVSAPAHPLGELPPFLGVGIYAIYYHGPVAAYRLIAEQNKDTAKPLAPIYVGKAVPEGARKGGQKKVSVDPFQSKALFGRLSEHAESIRAASTTLAIEDFSCRYLIVDEIWIPLGESLLIGKFAPVWNLIVEGFGNHDPGKGRYQGLRPRWDVAHPGRHWAEKCRAREESADAILQDAKSYLANIVFPASPHFVGEV